MLWNYVFNLGWIPRELAPLTPEAMEARAGTLEDELWHYALHNETCARETHRRYECVTEAQKLEFITENREELISYERFNQIIKRAVEQLGWPHKRRGTFY